MVKLRARTRAVAGSWRLPLVVLIGLLLAGALATVYGGLNRRPADDAPAALPAVVVASEPCAQDGARDTVRVVVDGRTERLPINACGNPEGFQLDVELVTDESGERTARLAGTAGAPGAALARRISAVLLVLAGLAGAVLVVQLAPGRPRAAAGAGPVAVADDPDLPVSPAAAQEILWPTEDPAERTDPHGIS